jgi:hypothetical protein
MCSFILSFFSSLRTAQDYTPESYLNFDSNYFENPDTILLPHHTDSYPTILF